MIRPVAGCARLYARASLVMPSRTITTSLPASTSRLARSMASSVIAVCSSAGRSKFEAITSPWTDRRMSVTSSGRSATRSTIRWTSGLLTLDRVGDLLHDRRLAGLRRRDDQAALALSDRREQVDDPGGDVVAPTPGVSRRSFESGNSGVRSSNFGDGSSLRRG